MDQACGLTFVRSLSAVAKHLSRAPSNLPLLQVATWNDYEEGTEIESGINNCLSVNGSVNGDLLSWTISGDERTLDHFTVFVSADGENLMSLGDVPANTRTFDLAPFAFTLGDYTVYVKAVGVASVVNHMSGAISYSPGASLPQ